MGKDALSGRDTWQDYSGNNAARAEKRFFDDLSHYFSEHKKHLCVEAKPKELKTIYVEVQLEPKTIQEIYSPNETIKNHGISPDYVIRNINTGKSLYVEVKRQDGWVEGKPRKAGRGNAHERSCKFFTPGLLKELRDAGNIEETHLPFWTVFQGDISRDPCRVREVSLWYLGCEGHFFFWRPQHSVMQLAEHFNKHLEHILD
jgi:hypothetical protein